MHSQHYPNYLKYVGIPLIILGIVAVASMFFPFAVGHFEYFFNELEIQFRPLFTSLEVNFWNILNLIYDPISLYSQIFTETIYNSVFNSFVPPLVMYLAIIIIIIGIIMALIGIFTLVKNIPLSLSIVGVIFGVALILLAIWEIIIFKEQIFSRIVDFELLFDVDPQYLFFVYTNMTPDIGAILSIGAGGAISILSLIAAIMSRNHFKGPVQRRNQPHKQMYEPNKEWTRINEKTREEERGPQERVERIKIRSKTPTDQINFCPNCGMAIKFENQKFCHRCGNPLPR
jgi:hypothetical protein